MMDANATNRRQVADFHAALLEAHGAPLREAPFRVPPAVRWLAVGRNRLFTDREPHHFFAATSESAQQSAREQGVSRPDLYAVCEHCARLLRVVNLRSTERLLRSHQSTERCLYRSILVTSLWAGFAPLFGTRTPRPQHAPDERDVLSTLDAFDNIGQERQTSRAWIRMPRFLAFAALRAKEFISRTPNLPRAASVGAILNGSETIALTLDQLEALQSADSDPTWIARALSWSEQLVLYSGVANVGEAHDDLACRAILETRAMP